MKSEKSINLLNCSLLVLLPAGPPAGKKTLTSFRIDGEIRSASDGISTVVTVVPGMGLSLVKSIREKNPSTYTRYAYAALSTRSFE